MIPNSYYRIFLIDTSGTTSNGNYAELDCEDIQFVAKYQVSDLADISTRKDAITQTITFKGTKQNNIVFGNLSNLNRVVDDSVNLSFLFNFSITKDIDCLVYENSTLILKGKLHFISANRDKDGNITYECAIKGYLADFFAQINNYFISDLDFTPFNHTYNITNIRNSWVNDFIYNGSGVTTSLYEGYVYPYIDYGAGITTDTAFDNKIDYRNFRPAFYLNEYFRRIFSQTGLTGNYRYTVTGSTDFLDQFNNAIIPNNDSDYSYSKAAGVFYELTRTGLVDTYNADSQTYRDPSNNAISQYNHLIAFNATVTGATGQTIISTAVTNGQIINFNSRVNTTVSATLTYAFIQQNGAASNANPVVRFQCLYRTSSIGQFAVIGETTKSYPSNPPSGTIYVNPTDVLKFTVTNQFEAGSQLAIVAYLDVKASNAYYNISVLNADLQIGSPYATSTVTVSLNDQAILVGQNTTSIKQVDFLKSVINMFNLYVYPDPEDSRHIIFIPYNDYYSNFVYGIVTTTALDWTNKIDNSTITQTPISEIFNLYSFTFKDDTDWLSKLYKERWGNTYGNLILTGATYGSNKSINLLFGSTPVNYYNGKNYAQLWELNTDNLKKPKTTAPRILFYNGLQSCPSYEIGEITQDSTTGNFLFTSLDVVNNTFNVYAEANEYTTTTTGDFVDLLFSVPSQVFYTNGGIVNSIGNKTLYDYYYANQINELLDSNTRIIETTAYLNENDIQQLDFTKPIFFDSVLGHNYFKLLSVDYSNKNTPATIRLQTCLLKANTNPNDFITFHNATYTVNGTSTTCGVGYKSEAFGYTVPYGTYSSFISQEDADAQAAADAAVNAQSFINRWAHCVYTGQTFTLAHDLYPTDAVADAKSGNTSTFYTDTGTMALNSMVFKNDGGGNFVRGGGAYYATSNTYWQVDSSSYLISSASTSGISGYTYSVYLATGSTQYVSCSIANNDKSTYRQFYSTDPTIRTGTTIYYTPGVTGSTVINGWYADGVQAYETSAGAVYNIVAC